MLSQVPIVTSIMLERTGDGESLDMDMIDDLTICKLAIYPTAM